MLKIFIFVFLVGHVTCFFRIIRDYRLQNLIQAALEWNAAFPPKANNKTFFDARFRISKKVLDMSRDIAADVEIKQRLADNYARMHMTSYDYQMGKIAGRFHIHFRNMIRWYRELSDKKRLQFRSRQERYVFNRSELRKYYFYFQQFHGEYNEIINGQISVNKLISAAKKARRRGGKEPVFELTSVQNTDDDSFDLFERKTRQILKKQKTNVGHGSDKENNADFELFDDHFEQLVREHKKKAEDLMKTNQSDVNQNSYDMKNAKDTNIFDSIDLEHLEREREFRMNEKEREDRELHLRTQNTDLLPEEPAKKITDEKEYKRMLRLKSYQHQRGNFSPAREGIDIDLADMMY